MNRLSEIKAHAQSLGLTYTKENIEKIIHDADLEELSSSEFLNNVLTSEIQYRQDKAKERRLKDAGFPYVKKLEDFDLSFCKSLTPVQFKRLSELTWIDGIYNLILAGPPGVGKTHLAIGLAYRACEEGYKASYTTMQSLMQVLRTYEIDRRSKAKLNRIIKSNLLVIDEVGYLPINATEGNLFFQLISELAERTSIIITTNKSFEAWTEFLSDAALATAILDRLSYRCDRIQMSGKSYRLENRQSFLSEGDSGNEI